MNATFQLQMLGTISFIPHNSDPNFNILIIELNNTFFFFLLINLNTLREGTNHDTCCLNNHCLHEPWTWTRLGLQTVQTEYWDHCSSAIPSQGIESLLPTFGVPLIPSIIRTEERTNSGRHAMQLSYIIRMHL